ncbi:hypothetical protein [Roseateles sp. L2-2]|uniref:hypothetical protein n=1 Tax=Roseateles sp. L2-2 TaxID=3422597 RepID=UPI003D35B1AA
MCSSTLEGEPRPVREDSSVIEVPIADHLDAVRAHHRFRNVVRGGKAWDLSHLDPFAFRVDPGLGFEVIVVVVFSSHCFTRSLVRDGRAQHEIPSDELFDDGREVRVLCEERVKLSQLRLPALIRKLRSSAIQVAGEDPLNFMSSEAMDDSDVRDPRHYVVFFQVLRDLKRRRRLLLNVQSAYAKELIRQRQRERRRVSLFKILKTTSLGQRVKA